MVSPIPDFESGASTNSTTPANLLEQSIGITRSPVLRDRVYQFHHSGFKNKIYSILVPFSISTGPIYFLFYINSFKNMTDSAIDNRVSDKITVPAVNSQNIKAEIFLLCHSYMRPFLHSVSLKILSLLSLETIN
jgi:hypothetical protein